MSKSAKDVPDAAVFKGDLDQMRTVAEQEEPEYEPRADAIRGGSAIIRSFSKARQSKQMEEARRLREEQLQSMSAIGENEQVEFDGIRRRRTTIRSSRAPSIIQQPMTPIRRKSIHPPLGMSRFPDEEEQQHEDEHAGMHPGFFSNLMKSSRSSKALPPTPGSESHPLSPVKTGDSTFDGESGIVHPRPQYMSQGLPPSFVSHSETDTSYKPGGSTHVQFASAPASDRPSSRPGQNLEPPAPPPHGGRPNSPGSAKRQFSFQNVFHRRSTASPSNDDGPRPVSRGGLSFISRGASRGGTKNGTEEERLGLVKGDSSTQLPSVRSESPPQYLSDPEDEWQVTDGSSSPLRTVEEGSFKDVEQTRLPRYTANPPPAAPDTTRQFRRNTNESPPGRQHGSGGGSGSQNEKGGGSSGAAFI
jgi:hypothetical protein